MAHTPTEHAVFSATWETDTTVTSASLVSGTDTILATPSTPQPTFAELMALLPDSQYSRKVWIYCSPFILAFGTFGSLMTLVVLCKAYLGSPALMVYFKALAVSDLCLLYTGLLRNWIKFLLNFEIRDMHVAVCKVHIFLVYLCGMVSPWFLVAMTSQRAMSVVWPHRIRSLCTRRSSKLVTFFILLFCVLLNAHNLYGYTLKRSEQDGEFYCDYVDPQYEDFARGPWPWIDLHFTSLLPFLLVIISNTILMWKVAASVRRVRRMTSCNNLEAVTQRKRESTSLTFTLVCLSSLFLILSSPLSAYLVCDIYFRERLESSPHMAATASLAWAVTNILWYTNSAVNFYLYCLSGSRFRGHVLTVLCCQKRGMTAGDAHGQGGSIRSISGAVKNHGGRRASAPIPECSSEF